MRLLYLECNAGVSGDMMVGSLSALLDSPAEAASMIESAGIPGIKVEVEDGSRSHIHGTKARIYVNGEEEGHGHDAHVHHSHRSISDVLGIIEGLNVSDEVKGHAVAIYRSIAEAEAEVHGEPVGEVHFHEVGMLDAIADIVGTCMLMERLAPERIMASPIRTGYGTVECAHGRLPIPAPATAILLKGMPTYAGDAEGEFTTPTGAAILKHFVKEYGQRPSMVVDGIGVGLGHSEREIPNLLRAFIGTSSDSMPSVDVLNCNIDDMTPEDLATAMDRLMEDGALDVMVTPITMKKGRPAHMLTCLCRHADRDRVARSILANTSTIGIRTWPADRYELSSHTEVYDTGFGELRVKVSEGYGVRKWKPEHDDLVRIASEKGLSVREVREKVRFDDRP